MKNDLPVLADLYSQQAIVKKENDLNILLNQEPNEKWIKNHPMASGVKYIPIEVIEYLLTSIFVKWKVEVRKTELIANSVLVTVRLHYKDPVSNEWEWQDGIGASPVQTNKGAAATDFTQVKNDSIMKCAPAAESFAIKDAAEKLGKLFGKDLNRKDAMTYESLKTKKVSDIKELPWLAPESNDWEEVKEGLRDTPGRTTKYYETWFNISEENKKLLIS